MFFESGSTKSIDVRMMYLSRRSIEEVVDEIFGHGNTIKISRFTQKLYETFPELRLEARLKTYVFLNFAVYDYYRCRRTADRAAENLKHEDEVAGISPGVLNSEQVKLGMNARLTKGFTVGLNALLDLKKTEKRELGEFDEELEDLEEAEDPDPLASGSKASQAQQARLAQKPGPARNPTPSPASKSPAPSSKRKPATGKENASTPRRTPDRPGGTPTQKASKPSAGVTPGKPASPLPVSFAKGGPKTAEDREQDKKYRRLVRETMESQILKMVDMFIVMDDSASSLE